MTRITIPSLRSERLVLRAFRLDDLDTYAAIRADPGVARFLGGSPLGKVESWGSMAALCGLWALRGYGMFAVEEARTGRLIGHAGVLHHADWPAPEIAYALAPNCWGQGYATEAARTARDWFLAKHDPARLVSFIMPENRRSIRVAEKLGARRAERITLRGFTADVWVHREIA